jgi:hypothetical protein
LKSEIRNPKSEIRNPKSETNPNHKKKKAPNGKLPVWCFLDFFISALFRISCFGFRIFPYLRLRFIRHALRHPDRVITSLFDGRHELRGRHRPTIEQDGRLPTGEVDLHLVDAVVLEQGALDRLFALSAVHSLDPNDRQLILTDIAGHYDLHAVSEIVGNVSEVCNVEFGTRQGREAAGALKCPA